MRVRLARKGQRKGLPILDVSLRTSRSEERPAACNVRRLTSRIGCGRGCRPLADSVGLSDHTWSRLSGAFGGEC